MCGIIAILQSALSKKELESLLNKSMVSIRHRGPDWNGMFMNEQLDVANKQILTNALGHERLTIIDPHTGSQPLYNDDFSVVVTVNGEIYNHKQIRKTILKHTKFSTNSDCEVIPYLYEEVGESLVNYLDGDFAFVVLDTKTGKFLAGRDPIGVNPLYYGFDRNGAIWFASELKALEENCSKYYNFPPGHIITNGDAGNLIIKRWYVPEWTNCFNSIQTFANTDSLVLRNSLIKAVKKRLMADVSFGVLLSGGLDSSLVASIASRYIPKGQMLKTFSIGLKNSPDLIKAKQVAEFLGTEHYSWTYTVEEGIKAIPDVIRYIESFDVTTVRASTPMYLLARRIRAMGVKMVLSGEGADEIFGGYLYFHKAPNAQAFFEETCRKIHNLHKYDCLRANKSTMAWSVEARVPFLDKEFLNVAMLTNPEMKMIKPSSAASSSSGLKAIEKYILRDAFDDKEHPYLPEEILWRQKEQFSDGVGYGWIDGLKDHAQATISNHEFRNAKNIFPEKTPRSKEEFLYRKFFESHYKSSSSVETVPYETSVACSTAIAAEWDAQWKNKEDPSGRAVNVHDDAYHE